MSKRSEAADAEGDICSSKDEIKGLNEDMAREHKAIIQFLYSTNKVLVVI